jgi:hypothetical protein
MISPVVTSSAPVAVAPSSTLPVPEPANRPPVLPLRPRGAGAHQLDRPDRVSWARNLSSGKLKRAAAQRFGGSPSQGRWPVTPSVHRPRPLGFSAPPSAEGGLGLARRLPHPDQMTPKRGRLFLSLGRSSHQLTSGGDGRFRCRGHDPPWNGGRRGWSSLLPVVLLDSECLLTPVVARFPHAQIMRLSARWSRCEGVQRSYCIHCLPLW